MGATGIFLDRRGSLAREIEAFFLGGRSSALSGRRSDRNRAHDQLQSPGHFKFGTLGRPVSGGRVRTGRKGEIQVRGSNAMRGCDHNPQTTPAVCEAGWFWTGAAGRIETDGFLVIAGRLKDPIITSGEKRFAARHIETVGDKDHVGGQITTLGDRRKFITPPIVPSSEAPEKED